MNRLAIIAAIIITMVSVFVSCSKKPQSKSLVLGKNSISWFLCNFYSFEELTNAFTEIANHKVGNDKKITNDGFKLFQITNGITLFTFVQVNNGAQGVPMFGLFCYQHTESIIILRNYVPVNEFWYRDILGKDLESFRLEKLNIFNDGEYIKVGYRNKIIFSASTNWIYK